MFPYGLVLDCGEGAGIMISDPPIWYGSYLWDRSRGTLFPKPHQKRELEALLNSFQYIEKRATSYVSRRLSIEITKSPCHELGSNQRCQMP